jgi:tetratricopeptide (TPR) repeat protein
MAEALAEIKLATGRPEEAVSAAHDAIGKALAVGRRKYEASARTVVGAAMRELGRPAEALEALRRASALADAIGHPPTRWRAHAELARAAAAAGDDTAAEASSRAARATIDRFAASLSEARRAALCSLPEVAEVLRA